MTELCDRENADNPEIVLADFDRQEAHLKALCGETRTLVEKLLLSDKIRVHSIQDRVKSRDKLRTKYSDPEKNYCKLTDMTDLVGLRIITYYEDGIDEIADLIKREFLLDPRSVDKRVTQPDKFGYFGLNLVCTYKPSRLIHAEYRDYAQDQFEIQITSILRHAWSEMEHDWYDMKERFPEPVKRRFYRLAALLELAEQEFVEIRKLKKQHENLAAARVEAEIPTVPIDNASLRAIIEQNQTLGDLDVLVARVLGGPLFHEYSDRFLQLEVQLLEAAELKTMEQLRASLRKYGPIVPEFVKRSHMLWRSSHRSSSGVSKGITLFHLAFMLIAATDADHFRKTMSRLKIEITPESLATQVKIAKQIVASCQS